MATALMHLRVADALLEPCQIIANDLFFAGSIAPDSNSDSANWRIPVTQAEASNISHWTVSGDKSQCHFERFYDTYIRHKPRTVDTSFYLGYYAHLVTDVQWSESIVKPLFGQCIKENPALFKTIKQDWRNSDALFIRNNPDFRPLAVLQKRDNLHNIWLDYYSDGAVEHITQRILDSIIRPNFSLAEPQYFLSDKQMTDFITQTADLILRKM